MPIINFDSLEQVPEGLREGAKPDDQTGKYVVNVVLNSKLDEFRERNVEQAKKLEKLEPQVQRLTSIVGEDPAAFENELTQLRDIHKRVNDGELKTNDQIEQAVQDRVKAVKDGYEETNKAARNEAQTFKQRAETLQQKLDRTRIDKEVTSAVIQPDSGVRPEALPDVLERAYRLFKVEDEKIIPKQGEATVFGSNGADPMTPSEWLVKLRTEAPHYFKGNNGGGAAGGADKIGGFTRKEVAGLSAAQKLALANDPATGGKR
jgi:hypothetical protein